jgi:hypothetical protein
LLLVLLTRVPVEYRSRRFNIDSVLLTVTPGAPESSTGPVPYLATPITEPALKFIELSLGTITVIEVGASKNKSVELSESCKV